MSLGVRYMLLATFAFALMNATVKDLEGFHVAQIILIRSVVSILLCWYGIKKNKLNPFGNNKPVLWARGFFGVIALSLYFFTLKNLPLASAVILQYLSPVFTAIVGIFVLNEKVKPIQWLFFLIAFSGAYMIKLETDQSNTLDANATIWVVFGVLAALFAGIAYVAVRKVKETDHPLIVVFYFPLVAIPAMLIWIFAQDLWTNPNFMDWVKLICVGIFTQVGQFYMAKALQLERAEKMVAMKYVGLVYALIIGFFYFGELPEKFAFYGIGLVILGVVLNLRTKHAKA